MNPQQQKRATGRTTRMLREAIAAAKTNVGVAVLAANLNQKRHLVSALRRLEAPMNIIRVLTPSDVELNHNLRPLGEYWNTPLFIDHHTIELLFSPALEQWIRWDDPEPTVNWVVDKGPEKEGEYLVTWESQVGRFVRVAYFNPQLGWEARGRVIAWAPLPKPFGVKP